MEDNKKNLLLEAVYRDVNYEVEMLIKTTALSLDNFILPKDIKLLALESWTIHFRNLKQFLYYKENHHPDDVVADDFLDQNHCNWISMRPECPEILEKNFVKVNKMTAHLTYSRSKYISENDYEWYFVMLLFELSKIYNKYVELFNQHNIFEVRVMANMMPENVEELDDWVKIYSKNYSDIESKETK